MSLSPEERESKAQMLVNPPDPSNPYVLPPNIGIVDRTRIEERANIIRRQNAVIARFNPPVTPAPATPAPATPGTQEPSTSGGKRRKSKRSKKNKRKRKTRR